MKRATQEILDNATWVCRPCGRKYGCRKNFVATWHTGVCGVCGEEKVVTEPRDFGHLKLKGRHD